MDNQQPVCAVCGTMQQLLRCAKCKTVYYCSTSHQHIDWPSHKQECRLLARQKTNSKQLQQLQQAVAATSLNSTTPTGTGAVHQLPKVHNANGADGIGAGSIAVSSNGICVGAGGGGGDSGGNRNGDSAAIKSNVLGSMSLVLGTNENEILNTQAESVSLNNSNGVGGYLGNSEANSTTMEQLHERINVEHKLPASQQDFAQQQSQTRVLQTATAATQQLKQQTLLLQHHQLSNIDNYIKQNEKNNSYKIGRGDENARGNMSERRYEEICRIIISDMNQYGLSVLDDFLGMEKGLEILREVHNMYGTGVFKDGQLASKSIAEEDLRTIRGDKITWVKGVESGCSSIGYLINQIDAVICRANTMKNNGILGNYSIRERTKAMVACYPGSGSHYVMHVDNPNHDGRVITAIYYLNMNWDANRSGGMLRIFPEHGGSVADIEPKFDRLIFFWSDMRNPHEVQPAHRTRYAITVWYFDANEREAALNQCRLGKSKANASNTVRPANANTTITNTTATISDICT